MALPGTIKLHGPLVTVQYSGSRSSFRLLYLKKQKKSIKSTKLNARCSMNTLLQPRLLATQSCERCNSDSNVANHMNQLLVDFIVRFRRVLVRKYTFVYSVICVHKV